MTKNPYAWSVRGVSRETRVAARNAARKRRVTTGEWVSLALITIADDELVVSPKSLLPIGPSPIAPSVGDQAIEKMSPRERALLALASKRPAPKGRAEQEQQAPWSIRGVSQVARVKAANVAAHRRVTIGEWVNHAVLVYAGQEAGVEAAPATRHEGKNHIPEVPEKTMRLVETLARHFDSTRASDRPEATIPDTLREVESPDQAISSALASESAPDTPPAISPDSSPATISQRPINATDHTDKKISQLADQVRDAERRNEKRLATLTSVLATVANRLQPSGDAAPVAGRQGRDKTQGGTAEDAAGLSKAEMVFWESIKDSNDPDAYESYLESFPDGLFASLAKKRAARTTAENAGETQPSPGAASQPSRRRPPPAQSVPKLDYDSLNARAIENTKRKN